MVAGSRSFHAFAFPTLTPRSFTTMHVSRRSFSACAQHWNGFFRVSPSSLMVVAQRRSVHGAAVAPKWKPSSALDEYDQRTNFEYYVN